MVKTQPHSDGRPVGFAQSLRVYQSDQICVSEGVNRGDALSFADELVLEDTYELAADATLKRLTLAFDPSGQEIFVAPHSELGQKGAELALDSLLTFMNQDGQSLDVVILVEVMEGSAEAVYAMPLGPIHPKHPYVLVGISTENVMGALSKLASVAFTKGTNITLETGAQRPIEELRVGDRVLTRDDGAQEIQWIGCSTLRAMGKQAPVLIKAGALNNLGDLRLSPEHRLFIYQRTDRVGAGRSEIFVRARHLLNGTTIVQEAGGFVDYYQILFADHHIIYAEGIAAESMSLPVDGNHALPAPARAIAATSLRAKREEFHNSFELAERDVGRDIADLLRRASTR
ncbi:MAG: Hint domain-containing protein [Pseudomonadota bacterium]